MHTRVFLQKTMRNSIFYLQHDASLVTISVLAIQLIIRHAKLHWCEGIVQLDFSYTKNVNVVYDKQRKNIVEFVSHAIDILMSDKHFFGWFPLKRWMLSKPFRLLFASLDLVELIPSWLSSLHDPLRQGDESCRI